jgi:predicted CopG family antitoxin
MKESENSFSRLQGDVLRKLYQFVQESDSQAKIADSSDSQQIEKLLEDLGEAFPFLRPFRQYRVAITQKYVIGAQSREDCKQIIEEITWPEHDSLVNSHTEIDEIVYLK